MAGSGTVANDQDRTQQWWSAVRCAGLLLTLLLLVDWGSGRGTPWRTALWVAVAWLLFAVLCPARVCAGPNWLASRRLGREHRVRTDLLVSVRCLDGVSQRLLLRDALGGRVEIDPEVLVRNPDLWLRLDEGARRATADGLLLCGETALRRLSARMDRETARAVFRASGLE
ncbi:hypothetical protein [Streptomyces broussonetiae]|uniref:Uncharacterized protein n=1 Tax=Streptomyces broussonetiae TaxID=2686304 RepID=A0A6I6NAL6_9ACTN|nr:hypothetical protein [Streptomyces broussonetiae]QHA05975.1 hypothetical protein GQF42_24185 [Streptomyces broussonetiae]